MVSDFFKYFFHSKITGKASHPFPLGFRRKLAENWWLLERHKLLMFVVEGAPGSSLGSGWQEPVLGGLFKKKNI